MIIFRKTILALTGLFICIFITAHLAANFLLLLPDTIAHTLYNNYSAFLRGNYIVTFIAYLNYLCIIFHIFYAIIITKKNKSTRTNSYNLNYPLQNSTWTSQNMFLLGFIILAFLIVHMSNFWFKVKFLHQESDLYQMVCTQFKNPYYVAIYVLAMLPLGLHLSHGVQSALKTLGLYHQKYIRWAAIFSTGFALLVGIGFAIIPLILFFK
jgi:succinate dehydrogenase / fumarate reductase cytochrome b subunit